MFQRIKERMALAREVGRFSLLLAEVETPSSPQASYAELKAMSSGRRTKSDALEELLTLLVSRHGIAEVLKRYETQGVSPTERLKEVYLMLIRGGAGFRIGTTFVPTAGIYDPALLMLLLQKEADGIDIPTRAITAIKYVEGRK